MRCPPTLVALTVATLVASLVGCAAPSRWQMTRRPDAMDAAAILASDTLGLSRDERPDEVPVVPIRKRLRPCCAFGTALRVSVGLLNIPGLAIGNIRGPDEIGRHSYDAGQRGTDQIVGSERNGLVYTCRGGFIDTAHVRDYADWTLYLATRFGRHLETGGVFELPDPEGGLRRFRLEPIDAELVAVMGRRNLTASLAVWAGYQMSIWHEIATWFGWASFDLFSERASAFSPEDLYSNLLGAKLAGAIISGGNDLSEPLFNRAVDAWLEQSLAFLGAVRADQGERAMSAVDGLWWDSGARLPDSHLVLRRSIQSGALVEPWLVPGSTWRGEGAASQGGCTRPKMPHVLRNPSRIPLLAFEDVLTFEVELEPSLRAEPALESFGATVNQTDFPEILEAVRRAAREEFGPLGDSPQPQPQPQPQP